MELAGRTEAAYFLSLAQHCLAINVCICPDWHLKLAPFADRCLRRGYQFPPELGQILTDRMSLGAGRVPRIVSGKISKISNNLRILSASGFGN